MFPERPSADQMKALTLNISHASFKLTTLPIDPIYTPFSNDDTAQILAVAPEDISYLKEVGLLEATCLKHELMRLRCSYCSYWDMLCATAAMSLVAVGWSIGEAIDVAFGLVDEIAGIMEEVYEHECIDLRSLALLTYEMMQVLAPEKCAETGVYGPKNISLKVGVDLLSMHIRCLEVLASEPFLPTGSAMH
jgi:hypothetical protein